MPQLENSNNVTRQVNFNWTKNGVICQNEKFNCDILKFMKNAKMVNFASLWQTEAWGQTVLPYRSISNRQKLIEKDKMKWFLWYDCLSRTFGM